MTNERAQRRFPRIRLSRLHRVYFAPDVSTQVGVNNLSLTGVGLLKTPAIEWPEAGAGLVGQLVIDGKPHQIAMRIMGFYGDIVGCQFEGGTREVKKTILDYFKVELSAVSMNEVSPSLLKKPEDGEPRLFSADNHCELNLVVSSDDQLIRYELAFLGNYFEGGVGKPLKYGTTALTEQDKGGTGEFSHKGSEIIHWMPLTPEIVTTATTFLQNIAEIPTHYRDAIIAHLKS